MDEMKRSSFFIQTIWKKSVIWYIIFLIDVSISYVSQPLYFSNGVKKKDCRSFWNEANFNAQQHPKDTRSNKTMNLESDKFPK